MQNNNLDQLKMIKATKLLRKRFPLHQCSHLLNISTYEIGEIHHPHSSEMHQQSNMVSVQVRKPPFTGEIFDNELHEWSISVL